MLPEQSGRTSCRRRMRSGRRGYPFERDFQQTARNSYRAALEEVDFQRATETARRTINAWVEKETQDKIKTLIQEGILTANTRLVLTNAIYFKGTWANAFRKEATRPGDFHRGIRGAVPNVPLMHQENVYPYLDGGTFQAIELPYQANELSMIILLPRAVDGLEELEQTLMAGRVKDWMTKMVRHNVRVVLPRFKATAQFQLNEALTSLGMREAFTVNRADFSGMEKSRRLFLSAVIHKAYVDVNETGTEAAAATAVVVEERSALLPSPPVPIFRADHPFFFVIRDNRTGSLLFAGRLVDPLAG